MAENYLVTGGAGFIGSHVVDHLISSGKTPVVVDNLSSGKIENLDPRALFYEQDITDQEMMERVFMLHRPTVLFHLAAQISVSRSVREPEEDAMVNIIGSLRLLKIAAKYGLKKVIFSSTGGAIYGDDVKRIPTDEEELPKPLSPYGIAKYATENYLRFFSSELGIKYTVLRYANVYGPRQDPYGEAGVVAIFSERMLHNQEVVIFGDGECVRDYVYVGDVARANLLAIEKCENTVINIGTGIGTSVNELFDIMKPIAGYSREAVHKEPRPGDVKKSILNIERARSLLGWEPSTQLERGIKETIEYFRSGLDSSQ
ncbi:UDP-glucose 4-epimerase [Mesotoga sp. HF07.pep.5.2.highcov]|uniref:NAD-dependent epimerase/dehydratase family protein n=1 Tax=Mesotoga TaxID=1184396 RepID=UPI000EF14573|nr:MULTISPECIES: NAD-dependent epimerase/dehydratase family protein [Mesotoga]RLL92790.1 UDP-glucose 4-epimerase [Mesotoga sp. HF07.pep.5.2.highcov]HNQ71113.1 NAD-dependent epimerase/dehydratase family protein [Mesotoga prima]HNS76006.1 NAD-dependent epimerase/dehydratase family protein [Mesotoga prima]HPQ91234.1 NAD-dependent epimerase/dehydratase family protein [Mesotoga prima]HQC14093.1 NAD-dependent epimerase/dehydratase family protein [Mesotoga prima]